MLDALRLTIEDGQWRAYFTVDGIAYRRTLGSADTLTEDEARDVLTPYITAAAVERIDDVTVAELAAEYRVAELSRLSRDRQQWQWSLIRRYVLPALGDRMVKSLTAPELIRAVRPIEAAGHTSTSHECLRIIGAMLRYGARTGRATDMTRDQHRYLMRHQAAHMATMLDRRQIGGLMRYICSLDRPVVRVRLLLQAYCATRSTETTIAQWRDVDLRSALWTLPDVTTKMRRVHHVPLAPQVVAMLRELRRVTGHSPYLFPSMRNADRPMGASVALDALRREYPPDVMTLHGWRSAFASVMVDRGWPQSAVDRQLGHKEPSAVWDAYYATGYLQLRRRVMRDWAEWLDSARDGVRCRRRDSKV